MKPIRNFIQGMPLGARLLLGLYAVGYLVALAGHYTHSFDLYAWLALFPKEVCKGEVWRCVTYAFLPNGIVDWAVSLFWMATLFSVLGRNWSSVELIGFCLLTTVAGAIFFVAAGPGNPVGILGCPAMIFGMLAAWYRLYGRERLVLLGVGEISVRQAAVLVGIIWFLVYAFCGNVAQILAMLGGGAIGWLYLFARGRSALNRHSQVLDSERIARLEI